MPFGFQPANAVVNVLRHIVVVVTSASDKASGIVSCRFPFLTAGALRSADRADKITISNASVTERADGAERIGPVWGFDENKNMRNMWTKTKQENFWIMGGAIIEARLNSRFLALEIKAALEGLDRSTRPRVMAENVEVA